MKVIFGGGAFVTLFILRFKRQRKQCGGCGVYWEKLINCDSHGQKSEVGAHFQGGPIVGFEIISVNLWNARQFS